MPTTGQLTRPHAPPLAWAYTPGASPTIVVLPGFRSDMTGDKATALQTFAEAKGQAMLRFDYSGHGASGGAFIDGSIGTWASDAEAVIEAKTQGPLVLIGSSMGGWIALLVAIRAPERVSAVIGIAAAPDFTEKLMWEAMTFEERARLLKEGILKIPSQYGDPTPITKHLIEDGRNHLLLGGPILLDCKVRLYGQADPDVPWEIALQIAERLVTADVEVTLIKDGDHRLSRPRDLAVLERILSALLTPDRGEPLPEARV